MEILEYDLFGYENLRVTPTVNMNGSLLKVRDKKMTEMKTKPVVYKRIIKSKLKAETLTEVVRTISKNKYKPTVEKIPQKPKTKIKINIVDST